MNTLKTGLLVSALTASAGAFAGNVFDTDGYERVTNYNYGPVASATITSEFAHKFKANLQLRNAGDSCYNATIFSDVDNQYITHATITPNSSVAQSISLEADITNAAALTHSKTIHMSCTDAAGESYNVLKHVPGAPVVNWEFDVQPAGEFVNIPYSYGYHSAIRVTSRLTVNNQSNSGHCETLANRGLPLGLFNGNESRVGFHSDVFTVDQVFQNDNRSPVLYQIIQCENAAGKTMAVKVLNLTNPTNIHYYEDQLIVK